MKKGIIPTLAMRLALILVLTTATMARAQFGYTTNTDGTLTLTNFIGLGGNITLPTTINGMTVSGISSFFLNGDSTVKSITIPGSITNLGINTFYKCPGLTNAILGNGITSIPTYMFSCSNLLNVTVPDSVTSIGAGAFAFAQITEVHIPAGVTNIGGGAFGYTQVTNITIPTGVTSIAGVFGSCPTLVTVTLPSGITNIDGAFEDCSKLLSVIIPSNVTSIGSYTFSYCNDLTNVVIPNSVTNIGSSAFYNCPALGSIIIPAGVSSILGGTYGVGPVYGSAFENCGFTNITILGSPTIGQYAFYGFGNLTSVFLGGGAVQPFAFQNCQHLTSLTFGNRPLSFYNSAFAGCPITSLYLPSNVTYVGPDVFTGGKLTNLVIAPGVGTLDFYAFGDNASLYNILILGNCPPIAENSDGGPFAGCPGTVFYLPGNSGWSNSIWNGAYGGYTPTAVWNPGIETDDELFSVRHGKFGFSITNGSTTNLPVAVLACTNLANPVWTTVATISLGDIYYFTDPQWTNYPARYYRLGFP